MTGAPTHLPDAEGGYTWSAGLVGRSLQHIFDQWAVLHPDKPWVESIQTGDALTYAETLAARNRLIHALLRAGIQPGDAVAVCMRNCPDYLVFMFAAHRAGFLYAPCSVHYSADELTYQLTHCEARVLLVDEEMHPLALEAAKECPSLELILSAGDSDLPQTTPYADFVASESPSEPDLPHPAATDLAMLMYTSGTTARPKGVMFDHASLVTGGMLTMREFRWGEEERFLHQFPLFHLNGGYAGIAPAIVAGATLVMAPKFSASRFAAYLNEHGITHCNLNSTHVKMILNTPETPLDRDNDVRWVRQGLSLDEGATAAFEERFGVRLCPTYGMTETLAVNVAGSPVGLRRVGSAGRVLPGYDITLRDEDGRACGPSEPGEVVVRPSQPHMLARGYFRDPQATRATFQPDGVHTGDIGCIDDDGFFWFIERKKNMIKRSGFNVAASEVERVISEVTGVVDVGVVGTPDAMREEAIVAFVVRDDGGGCDQDGIWAHCEERLADYKRPQFVEFVNELPRNMVGKLDLRKLREMALGLRIDSTARRSVASRGP